MAQTQDQHVVVIREPKRNLTPFSLFCRDNKPIIEQEIPNIRAQDLVRRIGEMWRNASEEVKTLYRHLAEADKNRYLAEKQEYEEKLRQYGQH